METQAIIAVVIFGLTYAGIIFTRLPGINIDRPSAAFTGAVGMVLFGVLSSAEAIAAIDFNTIFLLLGMMIIIASLQMDGLFDLISRFTLKYGQNRLMLLRMIVWITGLASAFLVNDAVVLMFTPVVITICRQSGLRPEPYLIAEILAANAGSAMTITGNPQNMLVGISSQIPYAEFLLRLLPVSLISLFLIVGLMRLFYRKEFTNKAKLPVVCDLDTAHQNWWRSGSVFLLVMAGFFLGHYFNLSIPLIALSGAALILLLGKAKPSLVVQKVDWVLLLFFASLFIVVEGIEKTALMRGFLNTELLSDNAAGLAWLHGISLLASQIVSNVPFAVLMLPLLEATQSEMLWLGLASASTLAGNATIIGAMANLIVIESADKYGIRLGFMTFFKIGIIVTLLSLLLSFFLLYAEFLLF